jgi:hypothetical protein
MTRERSIHDEEDAPPSFADGSSIGGITSQWLAVRSSIFGHTLRH